MIDTTISKEHVEKRVDDWVKRIANLYSSIQEWLDPLPSYEIKKENDVRMYEELMQKNDISERTLTSLEIYFEGSIVATVKPIGLWIVGANRRVDILLNKGAIMLVDISEHFEAPIWISHQRPKTGKGEEFNKEYFFNLLGVG
ncbi:hypothetical protein [Thiorhodovibrio frisius]|uniref:Uncharacterized protein n=1 Tax=Thiorhodovibrio frisius TaxID=631362 RepID=H8Z2H5_9GAMM|nr:hypothetical protein [Thiorhodovibrio frisius]EIC21630.1 hypothetical protein Thi970DRAFT_01846 [Thiorhodovibrio frisius]WPL21596.1 hypothetical protein Thiofri_01722 [Thiorhodovibrio frisius]